MPDGGFACRCACLQRAGTGWVLTRQEVGHPGLRATKSPVSAASVDKLRHTLWWTRTLPVCALEVHNEEVALPPLAEDPQRYRLKVRAPGKLKLSLNVGSITGLCNSNIVRAVMAVLHLAGMHVSQDDVFPAGTREVLENFRQGRATLLKIQQTGGVCFALLVKIGVNFQGAPRCKAVPGRYLPTCGRCAEGSGCARCGAALCCPG